MLERWKPALLGLALIQLLVGSILAVTISDAPVPVEGEDGLPPAMTVPFPAEAPNPATPVEPPADPGTGQTPAPGVGTPSPALPASVMDAPPAERASSPVPHTV